MAMQKPHVRNPSLDKDQLPKELGETRVSNGQLYYHNPMTDQWEHAVRLSTIRGNLLQGNGQTYVFPKKHGNVQGKDPLNCTSFLAQDQAYGKARATRNPILFQLEPRLGNRGPEPTEYARDDNSRIVLDAFDHGIRDFGNAMPLCLSTEIEGHDIETYMRRNLKITLYDCVARMPSGYWTKKKGQLIWNPKPPRAGNLSMRATRFRMEAGCLTWKGKGDSDAKNAAIMNLMNPSVRATCEATNSSLKFHDLTKEEQARCEPAKGQRPNKASRANRAKREQEVQEDSNSDEDEDQEEYGDDQDEEEALQPATRRMAKPVSRMAVTRGHTSEIQKAKQTSPASGFEYQQPGKGRKRSRNEENSDEESDEDLPQGPSKRHRANPEEVPVQSSSGTKPMSANGPIKRLFSRRRQIQLQASHADARSAQAFEGGIANGLRPPQSISNIIETHDLGYLFEDEEQDARETPEPRTSKALMQSLIYDGEDTRNPSDEVRNQEVIINVEPGTRLPKPKRKRGSGSSDHLGTDGSQSQLSFEQSPPVAAVRGIPYDASEYVENEIDVRDAEAEEDGDTLQRPRINNHRAKRSSARKGPVYIKIADTMRSATRDTNSPNALDTAKVERRSLKQAVRQEAQTSATYPSLEQTSPAAPTLAPISPPPELLDAYGRALASSYGDISTTTYPTTFGGAFESSQAFDLWAPAHILGDQQPPLSEVPGLNTYAPLSSARAESREVASTAEIPQLKKLKGDFNLTAEDLKFGEGNYFDFDHEGFNSNGGEEADTDQEEVMKKIEEKDTEEGEEAEEGEADEEEEGEAEEEEGSKSNAYELFDPNTEVSSAGSHYAATMVPGFDPNSDEFQAEVAAGFGKQDYRYVTPVHPDDIATVVRVLEFSRADYFQKTGERVPENLKQDHQNEMYASQQRHLDAHFQKVQIEAGKAAGESIYCLPKWSGGFENWRIALDQRGRDLQEVTQDDEF